MEYLKAVSLYNPGSAFHTARLLMHFLLMLSTPAFSIPAFSTLAFLPVSHFPLLDFSRPVKAPRSSHITPILRSLHWLKINERIEYKLLSLTYKVLTANLTIYTYTIISLFSLHVEPAFLLLSPYSSTICIFLITNHQPLF